VRYEPLHHTIVGMDVARSGIRDDQLQVRMRADLRAIVHEALARQGLDAAGIDHNDLGDGVRLIVPAQVTPALLLDPFVPHLAAALREHRKVAADRARLRLRLAVHMGLLHREGGGWAGEPLVHCARLLDAPPLRQVLDADDRADLVVIVSQDVYDKVVRHGYGLDPAAYRRTTIRAKETAASAWIHAPGYPAPPGIAAAGAGHVPAPAVPAPAPAGPGAGHAGRGAASRLPFGVRRGVRAAVVEALAALGLVAAIGYPLGQAFGPVPGWLVPVAPLACLGWAGVRAWRAVRAATVQREFQYPPVTVRVRVGDLLDEEGHVVVGFADTFDTSTVDNRVISSASLQGQLLARRFGSDRRRLDKELQAALSDVAPVAAESRDAKRWGKLGRYPIGTVAVLSGPGRHVFAVAYGRMGNDLVASSTVDDLWLSLSKLWAAIHRHGERLPVAMPIIGSGLARIDNLSHQNLLKLILLSFMARSRQQRICHEFVVVVHPADAGRIDLGEISAFLREL
jgi:hypothetical protein